MLMTYRYLTVAEVAKALQYYEEKTGMQYWYKDSAGEGDEEEDEEDDGNDVFIVHGTQYDFFILFQLY